jgi:phenylacetic acid degradation operon negative regulatory protein
MTAKPRSTRSQRVVFTLWGDYLRERTDEVWVGSLLQLLRPLGLSDQAVRSTLSRMLRRGWFTTRRDGRLSFYAPTPKTSKLLDEGETRLFAPVVPRPWDGRWHILSYSIPESQRQLRDRLRQRLVWLGYGNLNPGTWVSPYAPPDDLVAWLAGNRAGKRVDRFVAQLEGDDPTALVSRAWDLKGLKRSYDRFLRAHRPEFDALRAARSPATALDPEVAFARRFHVTEEFLGFPYVDPGLPAELLPPGWPGQEVRELFHTYHDILTGPANDFVDGVLAAPYGDLRQRAA